jgi:hypothetical protein
MVEHYEETGHAYCTSPDGRETRNLINGTFANRVAREKDGELVEMCAKEEHVAQYFQRVIDEQVQDQIAFAHERLRREREELEMKKRNLREKIEQTAEKLRKMADLMAKKETMIKRSETVKNLIVFYQRRNNGLNEANERDEREVLKLAEAVEEKAALVSDMNATVALSAAALLKGKNQEVHVVMKAKK